MSFVVVIVVALLAYVYIRSNRLARLKWLRKLDLPGHWQLDDEGGESHDSVSITFSGRAQGGDFRSRGIGPVAVGEWSVQGHTLFLSDTSGQDQTRLELHFFKPGQIGLELADGSRILLRKQANNVVALRPGQRG